MAYYRRRNYYRKAPTQEGWDDARVEEVKARLAKLTESPRLTPKFTEVVESFAKFVEDKRYLTGGQENFLKSIEEQVHVDTEWEANFTDKMREDMVIAANYYQGTCYFGRLVGLILGDDKYIPSERDYEKIVLNKYAQKAIAAHREPAKWKKGERAVVRTTARQNDLEKEDGSKPPYGIINKLHNQTVLVVGEEGGPRLYKTLKVMCPSVPALGIFSIEERKLKKYRGTKKK